MGNKKKKGMKGYLLLNVILFVLANSAALIYGLKVAPPPVEEMAMAVEVTAKEVAVMVLVAEVTVTVVAAMEPATTAEAVKAAAE